MNLFFEAGTQARCFLWMLPVGFIAAFMLESSGKQTLFRCVSDMLLILLAGFSLLLMVVFCRDTTLRMYHVLGMLTGAVLYVHGIRKIIRRLLSRKDSNRHAANIYTMDGKDDETCAEP